MKKIIYMSAMTVLCCYRVLAQEPKSAEQYKVPAAYHFDYKVVYEIDRDEKKTPETMSYYFTKSGDYMSMETPKSHEGEDMDFMVSTKDGLMITFGEEPVPKSPHKKPQGFESVGYAQYDERKWRSHGSTCEKYAKRKQN